MQIANDNNNDSVADTRYKYLQDTDTSATACGDINCCQASNLIDTFLADAAFLIFHAGGVANAPPPSAQSKTKLQSELNSESKLNSSSLLLLLLLLLTSFVF